MWRRLVAEPKAFRLSACCIHQVFLTPPNPPSAALQGIPEPVSPVTLKYQPHHGPVYSVSCSPFHRNVFLSASTDSSACIFSLLHVSWGEGDILLRGLVKQHEHKMTFRGGVTVTIAYLFLFDFLFAWVVRF